MKIVGVQHVEYDKKDGTHVEAYEVHAQCEGSAANGVTGTCVERFWLSTAKYPGINPKVGGSIDVRYNNRGYIDTVDIR